MSEISVKQGDSVEAGNVIGKSGGALGSPGSGGTTGPHLHYEFATCTKDPSVGTDPRYSNCGFKAIDCGTYTGWLTAVDEQYKRNVSCKNQYDSLASDAEESFEDSYTTNLDDTFETEESLETLEEESEE
jgi:murein DD-endopeptidase MepM/ murein hydrolase activator NlpD